MSYGDEQAEARRLRSILEEKPGGEAMTPPARPDPVAARPESLDCFCGADAFLEEDGHWECDYGHRFLTPPPESGYVLVNADMLAAALHQAMCDVSHHDQWSVCKNQRRYELIAASALAALKGPAR